MPVKSVPSYRLHKPSGQARVIIDGRHVYLGKFNSPESRQNYARIVAEMSLASPLTEQASLHPPIALLLISEVLVKYLEFAEVYYDANETSSKEFRAMIDAVAPVNEMYGDSTANEFGPLKLKLIRQYLINQDLCRTEINKRIGRIKRIFKRSIRSEGIRTGQTSSRERCGVDAALCRSANCSDGQAATSNRDAPWRSVVNATGTC